MLVVRVWEHIIVLGWPLNILLTNGIDVHAWGGVNELNVGEWHDVLVPVVDHVVH